MPGLDPANIDLLAKEPALGRIRSNIPSDFVFAPHFKLIFERLGDELWDSLTAQLRSGTYFPNPLVVCEVPKVSGLSRPGSIPQPIDRLLYQALADLLAPAIDAQLDSERVFSYRVLDPDPEFKMFGVRGEAWDGLKKSLSNWVSDMPGFYVVSTDITSCYSRISHHYLENLLISSGIPEGVVRLLVKTLLETWSGRFSYGIPQGIFPSDLIGNYFLTLVDTHFASSGIKSLRYVDDIYSLHPNQREAKASLVPLCRFLREIGLDINESKTRVIEVSELEQEETQIDRLFSDARRDVYDDMLAGERNWGSGFQDVWELDLDSPEVDEQLNSEALNSLWESRDELPENRKDQLDRFCLRAFLGMGSEVAIELVLNELGQKPHMTKVYCNYLAKFAADNAIVKDRLCSILEDDNSLFESETQWVIASLLPLGDIPENTVNVAARILLDPRRGIETRASCAIFLGKHGSAAMRALLRTHWNSEQSQYVRSAMVFATMFFPVAERNILLGHWGGQDPLFALVASAVRSVV